jgi:hypothetical protein
MSKNFFIKTEDLVPLVQNNGGCLATDHIIVEGKDIGYMYRELTEREGDTGWRFFSGEEDEDYMANNDNSGVYSVNTLANHEPAILEYLNTPAPCAFEREQGTRKFTRVEE